MYTARRHLHSRRNSPHPHANREDDVNREIGRIAQQSRKSPTSRYITAKRQRQLLNTSQYDATEENEKLMKKRTTITSEKIKHASKTTRKRGIVSATRRAVLPLCLFQHVQYPLLGRDNEQISSEAPRKKTKKI